MDGLLMFLAFLYIVIFVLPFLFLGAFSVKRYYRYRDVWNGAARAQQCKRDAIVFFSIGGVFLLFFLMMLGWA